jgi:type I restriction enzyme S subunit
MELICKQGFKLTEVGVIPEDWDVKQLGNISKINMGQSPLSSNYNSSGLGLPLVQGNADIRDRKTIIRNYTTQITKTADIGDIIMSVRAPVGEVAKSTLNCCIGRGVCSIKYSNEYIYQFLLNFEKSWSRFSTGSTFESVNSEQVKSLQIPLPPTLEEQKAIATALSDVDELITNLDQLITKKKAIKQGAMQQLLTPKENWTLTSLIELAENKKSNFDDGDWIESEFIIESGIRLIQTGNIGIGKFIEKGSKKYISEESFFKLRCKEVIKGDLLICRLAEPAGRACVMPNIGESKVITSVDVSIFRGDDKIVNREFLSQYFTTGKWFNQVLERVGGTTHKRISRGALGKIEFFLPNIEEQKTIAQILADMDLELDQLETKKAKYLNIKQGMMQELLTGKTRLV